MGRLRADRWPIKYNGPAMAETGNGMSGASSSPRGGNHETGCSSGIPEVGEVGGLPRWWNPGLARIETPLSSPRGGRGGNGVQSAFTLVNKVEKDFK